eukprot:scaffold7995_cov91-Skeletonema_dohrnii-CCMP3373.AAC.5
MEVRIGGVEVPGLEECSDDDEKQETAGIDANSTRKMLTRTLMFLEILNDVVESKKLSNYVQKTMFALQKLDGGYTAR